SQLLARDAIAQAKRTIERRRGWSKRLAFQIPEHEIFYQRFNAVAELAPLPSHNLRRRRIDLIAPVTVYDDNALVHLVDDALKLCGALALGCEGSGRKFFGADAF